MLSVDMKRTHLGQMRDYRKRLMTEPKLRNLFLELTLRCNEHCLHCGSHCGDVKSEELTVEQYRTFLEQVKEDMTTEGKMLCITGGEPLVRRKDIIALCKKHNDCAFHAYTNGTLIDDETKIVPQSALDAIRALRKAGHLVFLNSGRTLCFLEYEMETFGVTSAVCGCGTQIIVNGSTIFEKRISYKRRGEIRKALKELKVFDQNFPPPGSSDTSGLDAMPI